jgi:hypothetical protein
MRLTVLRTWVENWAAGTLGGNGDTSRLTRNEQRDSECWRRRQHINTNQAAINACAAKDSQLPYKSFQGSDAWTLNYRLPGASAVAFRGLGFSTCAVGRWDAMVNFAHLLFWHRHFSRAPLLVAIAILNGQILVVH